VRTPAALCGVVGLKPTYDALPVDGVFPLSETCDHVGFLTADVDGAELVWDVLGAPGEPVAATRVGVLVDEYWQAADPVLTAAVDSAVATLRTNGVQVVEIRTPMITELAATYPTIVGAEAWATHARWLTERPEDYQQATRERLTPFRELSAQAYVDALRIRRRLTGELAAAVDGVDALVLPTTRLRATPIGVEEVAGIPVRPSLLALTLPFNLTGWPAVTVPGQVSDGGLPAGVQIVGTRLDERGVLRLARTLTS